MSLKQTVNHTNYSKDSKEYVENICKKDAVSERIWKNRAKILAAVEAIDNDHNSKDTKCKVYTSII